MRVRFTAQRDYALTVNHEYDVLNETTNKYYVRNNNDVVAGYLKSLFVVVEGTNNAPQEVNVTNAPRRRGRPTNAEIAARNAQAQPVEDTAAIRRHEAEEAARRRQQEEAAARTRNNRIRTEQEIIDTLDVNFTINRTDGNNIGYQAIVGITIRFDARERHGDAPELRTISDDLVLRTNQSYSCGIIMISGVETMLSNVLVAIPYARHDYELLTRRVMTEIFTNGINTVMTSQPTRNNAGILTMSITTRNPRHLSLLTDNTEFREVTRAVNGNSNNTIVILNKVLRNAN